jgi:hypothetical protein
MKKSAFIISKPIQYVNATNIPDTDSRQCFLVNEFYNVEKFKSLVEQETSYWQHVSIYETKLDAVKYVIRHKDEFSRLYIDSDFGIVLNFYLKKLGPVEVYTYEEGYASYSFIRKSATFKDRFKAWVAGLLQLENWVGAHPATKGMYLYQPEKFQKTIGNYKPIYAFRKPFMEHIFALDEIKALLGNIQEEVFADKNVLLYLTSWNVHPAFEEYMDKGTFDYRVIKPHPHIKHHITFSQFDLVVDNYIPAEVLIRAIMAHCRTLTILHEGSFALEYFQTSSKLKLVLLDKEQPAK